MRLFILDMETLGIRDTSVVLSIGMTYIQPDERATYEDLIERGFYAKLDRKEQVNLGRTIEKSCVKWWAKQGDKAKEVLSDKGVLPFRAWHQTLYRWAKMHNFFCNETVVMSRGLVDARWAESLGETFKVPDDEQSVLKFPYYRSRDTRTALDVLCGAKGPQIEEPVQFIKHHALHDAAMDGLRLLAAFGV